MTKFSFRSIPGLSAVRDNPDLWAIAVLVLVLAFAQVAATAPAFQARVDRILPEVAIAELHFGGPAPMEQRFHRVARLTRVVDRVSEDVSPLDIPLDEWAARMERKKEKLWKRLEEKMRRLEERIEKQETKLRSRAIATREE